MLIPPICARSTWTACLFLLSCDSSTDPSIERNPPEVHFISAALAPAAGSIAGMPDGGIVAWSSDVITFYGVTRYSRDGAKLWTVPIVPCQRFECSLSVDSSGDVYVPATNSLLALNASGVIRWKAESITGAAVSLGSDNRVYGTTSRFPIGPPAITALDKTSGGVVWQTAAPIRPVSTYLDESRSTVYATGAGGIVALNSLNGSERWRFSSAYCSDAAIGAGGEFYVLCATGEAVSIRAIDPDGTTRWTSPTGLNGPIMSPLIEPDGTILITGGNGMKAFASSGEVLWTYSVSGDGGLIAYSDPVIDAELNIYFVEKSESVTAPAITVVRDGKRVAKLADVRDPHGRSFLLSRDGRVFYDAAGSIVYFESRGFDPSSPWPMSGRTPGRAAQR